MRPYTLGYLRGQIWQGVAIRAEQDADRVLELMRCSKRERAEIVEEAERYARERRPEYHDVEIRTAAALAITNCFYRWVERQLFGWYLDGLLTRDELKELTI